LEPSSLKREDIAMHATLKMAALTLAAATLAGCVLEPTPYYGGETYYASPAPVYVGPGYYYGSHRSYRYGHGWRGGGWHGDGWRGGGHHWH
jgi:hypothetical protein